MHKHMLSECMAQPLQQHDLFDYVLHCPACGWEAGEFVRGEDGFAELPTRCSACGAHLRERL